jgi:hypothetical protein
VFGASDFFAVFQQFLVTLGVPIAVWAGIMVGDVLLRKKDYSSAELFNRDGRYGAFAAVPLAIMAAGTAVGWGFIVNGLEEARFLNWLGYLMGSVGGKAGPWADANLGVVLALGIGLLGTLVLGRRRVRAQEAVPLAPSGRSSSDRGTMGAPNAEDGAG